MDQKWFEMAEFRSRQMDRFDWITLRADIANRNDKSQGELGYEEQYFGLASAAVPIDDRAKSSEWAWKDVAMLSEHRPVFEKGTYLNSETVDINGVLTVALVLVQPGNFLEPPEWHLNQDLVLGLSLRREFDEWVALNEGYMVVARLTRKTNAPICLDIKAEFLKDYLAARGMGLAVTTFRQRASVEENADHISWKSKPIESSGDGWLWHGGCRRVIEGFGLGEDFTVIKVTRTNVDLNDPVPEISESDQNVLTEVKEGKRVGRELVRIEGRLWRTEWVNQAEQSPRVRGDSLPSSYSFKTEASGKIINARNLDQSEGWLWFHPGVINKLLQFRGSRLDWYTFNTGAITASPAYGAITFGINNIGLVNVLGYDLFLVPEWQLQIWAGSNLSPDGGVSEELLMAQKVGDPARTNAPEAFLEKGLRQIDEVANLRHGIRLFKSHPSHADILNKVHRFRAEADASILPLAKDLARLTADSLDIEAMRKTLKVSKDDKRRALKLFEALLAASSTPDDAARLTAPLHYVYNLRLGDAHLPSNDLHEYFALLEIDQQWPLVRQASQMLQIFVDNLFNIADVINKGQQQK